MRGIQAIAVVLGAVLLASCGKFGSRKLVSTHTAYNDAVQLTVTREVLTNIVRARYSDPMQFVKVASINAQFSVSVGGSAGVAGGAGAVAGRGGGTIGYSDSPTITYVPSFGCNAFYKSLHSLLAARRGNRLRPWIPLREDGLRAGRALSLLFTFGAINGGDRCHRGSPGSELYNSANARPSGDSSSSVRPTSCSRNGTPAALDHPQGEGDRRRRGRSLQVGALLRRRARRQERSARQIPARGCVGFACSRRS